MKQARQLCVGVAAAGIFGLGSAVTAAVAHADPASDSGPSASAGKIASHSAPAASRVRAPRSIAATRIAPPALLRAKATAVHIPARPAPQPISVPGSPLPFSVSGTASSATARSRISDPSPSFGAPYLVAASPAAAQVAEPTDPVVQHVLVIGIDGTNLGAILQDDFNQNLFDLMDTGTTAASTITGHTTISNPSWTGVLTGVWSETAGVSNNVFTPWTYDTWPTIFNQLETYNPAIQTTAIGNWDVIAKIAGAGSIPADVIKYYPQINDSWTDTDDEVGTASIDAIENTAAGTPSFQFTYFVGVDETGHEYSAGSPQYADALRNVDVNIGEIMESIDDWEEANPGEEWTVILTTDHGQDPSRKVGFLAHGFQTPYETTTFVIANGPDFQEGAINNTYLNIDVTPTVAQLFGISPEPYSQGMALMDRSAYNYQPTIPGQEALKDALNTAINMYGYPDIVTNLALAWRTIATTIPYVIYSAFNDLSAGLPDFLSFAVKLLGAIAYDIAYIPAQIVARITGVTGNSIIPETWWPYTPTPGTQTEAPESAAGVACGRAPDATTCLAS